MQIIRIVGSGKEKFVLPAVQAKDLDSQKYDGQKEREREKERGARQADELTGMVGEIEIYCPACRLAGMGPGCYCVRGSRCKRACMCR